MNKLTPPPITPEWRKFWKHLFRGFAPLLWSGSVFCFVVFAIKWSTRESRAEENAYIGMALAVVVIVSGVFTYYQVSQDQSDQIWRNFAHFGHF